MINTTRIVTEDIDGKRVIIYPLNEALKIILEMEEDPMYGK